ncbi:MAG: cytochrome c biogenesis protein CcsA [Acidobacteria bacterium]|nr:cytochrome c biogenesis protein CcsA [Acidobacteriota bacterium]
MSIFWLRVAAALYSLGLLHAMLTVLRRTASLFRPATRAFTAGVILHGVALVERGVAARHLPVDNFYESASVCAFLIALVFLFVHWRYEFASLSVFLFPLVFVLTLAGALEFPVAGWSNPRVRDAWLLVHVLLILIGYASLLLTAVASVFYLAQERHLKRKQPWAFFDRLPPLSTLDQLITRSMGFAFAFITLGVIAASVWAIIESGTRWIGSAKIGVAFLTWGACLVMVFLRTSAGWRGRKAALLSVFALGLSAVTWAAHVGLRKLLTQ